MASGYEAVASKIDAMKTQFFNRLKEALAIPSVSADHAHRDACFKMAQWVTQQFTALGATMEIRDNPLKTEKLDGKDVPLPPIVVGQYGNDEGKKTLLLYNHFDVQPALQSDGWAQDPFDMTIDEAKDTFIGRGSTDDKGPLIGWINVIEAYQKAGKEFPVNLKFCFEGMEESGSVGLEEFIAQEAKAYFKDVDAVAIVDNYWLGTRKPALVYGLRGVSYYRAFVQGPRADLHSGIYGGAVHEPMVDLVHLMSKLVKPNGEINIPGIHKQVRKLDPAEAKLYDNLDYTLDDFEAAVGARTAIHSDVKQSLMHRWRYPSVSLHGIEGAFSGSGAKTVIPAKVAGKFSIRTVPDMTLDETFKTVSKYMNEEFAKLGSKNKFEIEDLHSGPYWLSHFESPLYVAAQRAIKQVWGVEPEMVREAGSIPITISFQDILEKSVILLTMGRSDDGAHSTNEKLNISNFVGGMKVYSAFVEQLKNSQLN